MLGLWRIRSTPSFPSLPGPLWSRTVAPDRALGSGRIDTAIWMHYLDANWTSEEEAREQLHKNAASYIEQVLAATPHKAPTIRQPNSRHENYTS